MCITQQVGSLGYYCILFPFGLICVKDESDTTWCSVLYSVFSKLFSNVENGIKGVGWKVCQGPNDILTSTISVCTLFFVLGFYSSLSSTLCTVGQLPDGFSTKGFELLM